MRLYKLTLQNFCGIKSLTHDFGGTNCSVYADNGLGKTTLIKALTWLLINKDHTGNSTLDPAPLDADNNKIPNIEVLVEAQFEDKGQITTLKRTLSDVWTKPRGCKDKVLTGNKSQYYIDDVPQKESDYTFYMSSIAQSEIIKMLMIPSYFATMAWEARRKFLVDICGDITDEVVISSNPELTDLTDIVGNHSIPDFLKIAKQKMIAIKKEIEFIPAKIAENQNAMANVDKSEDKYQQELKALNLKKSKLKSQLDALSNDNSKAEQLSKIKSESAELKANFITSQTEANSKINDDIKVANERIYYLRCEIDKAKYEADEINRKLESKQAQRDKLLADHKSVSQSKFEQSDVCPVCKQTIPDEQLSLAVEEYNLSKSKQLEDIVNKGKECSKEVLSKLSEQKESLNAKISDLDNQLSESQKVVDSLQSKIDKTKYEETEECQNLRTKYAEILNAPTNDNEQISVISGQIDIVDNDINAVMQALASLQSNAKITERIAQLQEQHNTLADELLKYERGEYLCELFTSTKMSMLDDKINSKFDTVKFKLFHQQVNGGIAEVCRVLIPCESGLVDYDKANNASKINAGLEIVNILSQHFKVEIPVMVDNAESVTRLLDIPQQTIALYVSEDDKTLKFINK